jgi:hypothetical protein
MNNTTAMDMNIKKLKITCILQSTTMGAFIIIQSLRVTMFMGICQQTDKEKKKNKFQPITMSDIVKITETIVCLRANNDHRNSTTD